MSAPEKTALIDRILTRTAEQLGDITDPVMALYYRRFPHARKLFELHSEADLRSLEGQMVEQALYCLMYWFDSPGEIEILLLGSVPHHNDTLHVPPDAYRELLVAAADVVEETIPLENSEELAVWEHLRSELTELIDRSSKFITTD